MLLPTTVALAFAASLRLLFFLVIPDLTNKMASPRSRAQTWQKRREEARTERTMGHLILKPPVVHAVCPAALFPSFHLCVVVRPSTPLIRHTHPHIFRAFFRPLRTQSRPKRSKAHSPGPTFDRAALKRGKKSLPPCRISSRKQVLILQLFFHPPHTHTHTHTGPQAPQIPLLNPLPRPLSASRPSRQ
jgi:hypothetical protein